MKINIVIKEIMIKQTIYEQVKTRQYTSREKGKGIQSPNCNHEAS